MTSGAEAVAVILARSGSRGLPGKNEMTIAGRPMICHTITHALEAETISRIIVSTDGDGIAVAAESMGDDRIEVLHRPSELATDTTPVDEAARHAVAGTPGAFRNVVILYANVPRRPYGLIDRAVRLLIAQGADSVQSYRRVGSHHPYWMVWLDESGMVRPYCPNGVDRRQDLPPLYLPDGGVIAVTRASLLRPGQEGPHGFLGRRRLGFETQPGDVIDVDTPLDLAVAEALLSADATGARR